MPAIARETAFPNTIIRASAGTGKTFQLSNRYLQLLVAGVSPESILASTFTRKAAGEILDRVVQRLAKGALNDDEARELAQQIERPDLDQARALQLLSHLLTHLDRLQISTLDSFFARLARRYCLELGLSPHWSIVDEARDAWLREESTRRVLKHGQAAELIRLLAKGETERSIGQLIDQTLQQLYDIYLDALESAWAGIPQKTPLETAAINEALAELRKLKPEKTSIADALKSDLDEFEMGDFEGFMKDGLGLCVVNGQATYRRTEIPAEIPLYYRRLLTHIESLELQDVARRLDGSKRLLDAFDAEYQKLKQQEHALRFGDVSRLLDEGLETQPPRYDPLSGETQIAHVLLDEFQDTNPIQWRILRPIANHVTESSKGSFFCVGDAKQAIYGWRGGAPEILEGLGDWMGSRGETKQLVKSFRSSPVVMQAVNEIFKNLDRFPDFPHEAAIQQWQNRFETHESAKQDLQGHVELTAREDPYAWVADQIATDHRKYPDLTFAVLVRTNELVREMMSRLTERGVPASEESGKSITDSAAVQVILSALRWIDYPGDSAARFHVARTPLGQHWKMESNAKPFPASAAEETAAKLRADLLHDGYGVTIEAWVRHLLPHVNTQERRRLGQLVDMAFLFDRQATLRPYDFVQHARYQKVSDPSADAVRVMNVHQAKGLEFDVVYLPNLEVPLVGQTAAFVTQRQEPATRVSKVRPYLNKALQKILPKSLSEPVDLWRQRSMAESLSGLYVAVTRAARALYLVVEPRKGKTSKVKKSWSGVLLSSLNDGALLDDGETGFELGSRACLDQKVTSPEPGRPATQLTARPVQPVIGSPDRSRLIRSTSPSAQEGGDFVRPRQLLSAGSQAAMTEGSAVHAALERLVWLDTKASNESWLSSLDSFPLTSVQRNQINKLLVDLLETYTAKSTLEQEGFRDWAHRRWPDFDPTSFQFEVQCEYSFATIIDDQLWSGAIDRLTWIRSQGRLIGADILDYKTDKVDVNDDTSFQERIEHYRPQLLAYRNAISRMTNLDESHICSRLWFLYPNQLVDLNREAR